MRGTAVFHSPLQRASVLSTVIAGIGLFALAACGRADAASGDSSAASAAKNASTNPSTARPTAAGDTLADSVLIARADRGRLLGRDSGAVWLVVISDYQCPYCKQWHDSSMAQIKRDYVDQGKVRMAMLHLPLPQHPHARLESEASLCAGVQGKFWEYSEALFRDQGAIGAKADVKPYLDSLARANSIEMTEFARCRASKAIQALIESDVQQATQAGVRSTPSFLVGEFLVQGAAPYSDFRKAIDTAIFTAAAKRSR